MTSQVSANAIKHTSRKAEHRERLAYLAARRRVEVTESSQLLNEKAETVETGILLKQFAAEGAISELDLRESMEHLAARLREIY